MSHPPVFYKLFSASTARLVLESSRLRWSSPSLFNDVAEFQRMPRFEPTLAEAHGVLPDAILDMLSNGRRPDESRLGAPIALLLRRVKDQVGNGMGRQDLGELLRSERPDADEKMAAALREHWREMDLSKARILCVTTSHDNDVMWGTYASGHSGCVLGFKHMETESTPLLAARQVHYTDLPPVVGSGLDFLLYGETAELRARTVDAICFTKKAAWAFESEWRALTWRRGEADAREYNDHIFYADELESVTLGVRMTESDGAAICRLIRAKFPKCSLYRQTTSNGKLRAVKWATPNPSLERTRNGRAPWMRTASVNDAPPGQGNLDVQPGR